MVEGDGDQALAAEPGFRSVPPGGKDAAVIDRLPLTDPVDGVDPYPLKNSQPRPLGEAHVGLVVVGLAGGVAAKAAAWSAVERVLDGKQVRRDRRRLPQGRPHEALAEGELDLPVPFPMAPL